ncbi:hypothetical protein BpHYR1_043955 [Brachionus plicatilis]|uniref:Uncharacterized protein n=1 Tax=Brachionus plicatilis TaxID=10195 RepID=A0A3M7Q1L9_BRAPC|nr:hypothetical protein BpHYR1_043955 [Brachionus plicatilis]
MFYLLYKSLENSLNMKYFPKIKPKFNSYSNKKIVFSIIKVNKFAKLNQHNPFIFKKDIIENIEI